MSKSFKKVLLGDVCRLQNGFAFKSKLFKPSGVPVLRICNIQNESISMKRLVYVCTSDYTQDLSRYSVINGDLLIAMSGATTGKVGYNNTDTDFLLNQRVGKFIPGGALGKKYLYYFLLSMMEQSLLISAGSAQPNLSTKQIDSFSIPLPPLPEQKRIIEILDEAFEAIDKAIANTEKNIKNAEELYKSTLNSVFSETGPDWLSNLLGDVCRIQRGGSPRPIKAFLTNSDDGINWIKIADATASHKYISSTNQKIIPDGVRRSRMVYPGEFLLSNSMSFGKPYILKIQGCIHDGWLVLGDISKTFNQDFLYHFLTSKVAKDQLSNFATGSTVRNLNTKSVAKLLIHYPSISRQEEISKELDDIEAQSHLLRDIFSRKVNLLLGLKQSILQKAFTGELTKDFKAVDNALSEAGV